MADARAALSPGPHGGLSLAFDAVVLDVGLSGLAIESETRLTLARPLRVRLGETDDALVLPGRVVWCFFHGTVAAPSGEQRPVYRAGVEFVDLLTPAAHQLMAYLEREVAPDSDTRLFGRFPLTRTQSIGLAATAEFLCLELGDEQVTVEAELGVEPVAGATVVLEPRSGGAALAAPIVAVHRGEAPELWRLELDVRAADPQALAALRGVVAN